MRKREKVGEMKEWGRRWEERKEKERVVRMEMCGGSVVFGSVECVRGGEEGKKKKIKR